MLPKLEEIDSEKPDLHWKYIECKNQIAVDLGCGRWEHIEHRDPSWLTTPEYLLQLGASSVYAFDTDQNEINWYTENVCPNHSNLQAFHGHIDSVDKIRQIYKKCNPDVIKCDIEHNETFILELTDSEFSIVQFYAIETHSDDLYNRFIERFSKLGYAIVALIDLVHARPMKVIFAKKQG